MARFSDRVAVVTGGAMGIGGATARRLAADGARVLVCDIDADLAGSNVERIRAAGGTAEAFPMDVGTEAGVRQMIERAVGTWGRLDIVVNNAYAVEGIQRVDATQIGEDHWDRGFDVGLKAMFRAARFAVPHMRAAGGGSIVN